MAWMYHSIFYVLLLQATVSSFDEIEASASQRITRSADPQSHSRVIREYDEETLQIPEECKKLGICEVAPHDKDDLVTSIIEELLKQNKTFTQDVLAPKDITTRVGPT